MLKFFALASVLLASFALAGCGGGEDAYTTTEVQSAKAAPAWGTYMTPFAANSPWNSYPLDPVFGSNIIPASKWNPGFSETSYSTGVFLAQSNDPAVTVTGTNNRRVADLDMETSRDVVIPRWPTGVVPAVGTDAHASIVDPVAGIIHSFGGLAIANGKWTASFYTWTRIEGRGWGDPAHYYQGVRATGVPPMAGLIRKHEVASSDTVIRHALAISLTHNGLASSSPYVYPATSADGTASINTGKIPEGALLMLPSGFDVTTIKDANLRKVAQTLKKFGAYVVDRNDGVPFCIYAEPGTGLQALNSTSVADLQAIRLALREVVASRQFVDGNNVLTPPTEPNLNLLSMRGTWQTRSGPSSGSFDTYKQSVVIPPAATRTSLVNWSTRGLTSMQWANPVAGRRYRVTAATTGDATLRIQLWDVASGATLFDSGELENGKFLDFAWPSNSVKINIFATSGIGQLSTVSGDLRKSP